MSKLSTRLSWWPAYTPPVQKGDVLVELIDGSTQIDHVDPKTFDQWADGVTRWAYINIEKDNEDDQNKELGYSIINNSLIYASHPYFADYIDKHSSTAFKAQCNQMYRDYCRGLVKGERSNDSDTEDLLDVFNKINVDCRSCCSDGPTSGDDKSGSESESISDQNKACTKKYRYSILEATEAFCKGIR